MGLVLGSLTGEGRGAEMGGGGLGGWRGGKGRGNGREKCGCGKWCGDILVELAGAALWIASGGLASWTILSYIMVGTLHLHHLSYATTP